MVKKRVDYISQTFTPANRLTVETTIIFWKWVKGKSLPLARFCRILLLLSNPLVVLLSIPTFKIPWFPQPNISEAQIQESNKILFQCLPHKSTRFTRIKKVINA